MVKNSQCGVGVAYNSKVASKLNNLQNTIGNAIKVIQTAGICLVFKYIQNAFNYLLSRAQGI